MMAHRDVPVRLPTRDSRATAIYLGGEELVVLSVEIPERVNHRSLSSAEREVADLAILGGSNESIARARGTSVRTVANQLANVFRKLGVGSRFELAAVWGEEGACRGR